MLPMSAALSYAAAPLFGLMALVTSLHGDVTAQMLCGSGAWWGGMTAMYLLMAVIHLAPWLMAGRRLLRRNEA